MKNLTLKKQRGVGLIEVLISTVVIAIGLLGVASLQTGFLSGSGDNKTRAEALVLAEQKLEELRNNAEIGTLVDGAVAECTGGNTGITSGYRRLCPGDTTETIGGTNASFTRKWTIADLGTSPAFLTNAPARRNISVQVSWNSDGGADSDGDGDIIDPNEKVNVVTEMSWINPADSASYASTNRTGIGAVPSPRQNASEDVGPGSKNILPDATDDGIGGGTTSETPGTDSSLTVIPDGGVGSITVYQVGPGSHYYTATRDPDNVVLNQIEPGVIALLLCDSGVCTHIQNHFGGVVLRHTGTVYSSSTIGITGITVAWTSSKVNACYNSTTGANSPGIVDGRTTTIYTETYECPFAGNCNATPDDQRTRTATNTEEACFNQDVVTNSHINARHVGPGGEYGDVGLLGVKASTGNREEVCFLEDTVAAPADDANLTGIINASSGHKTLNEAYLFLVNKRFYVTRRIIRDGSKNIQLSEGINRSYSNHNFLVIDRKASNKSGGACDDIAIVNNLAIPTRNITRTLDQYTAYTKPVDITVTDNEVQPRTDYAGASGHPIVVKGTVDSTQATGLRMYIDELGSCYIKADSTDYACVAPASTTSVTLRAGSEELPGAATLQSFSECDILPSATCNWTSSGFGNF